jgi:hypothetical protein
MKTIEISKLKLAKIIIANSELVGDGNWAVYTDMSGNLDVRHSTHDNELWIELYNFYSGYPTSHDDDEIWRNSRLFWITGPTSHDDNPAEFSQLFDNSWLYRIKTELNRDSEFTGVEYELGWE